MISTALSSRVSEMVGAADLLKSRLDTCTRTTTSLAKQAKILEESRVVIQAAASITQQQLEYRISELVTLALASVFPRPYSLVLRFENKAGRTWASLLFKDVEGNEVEPMEACGYGAVDVASFALRLTLWTLKKPRTRNVILLDEPFKFVSKDLQPKVAGMLSELSKRLKVQFIIVTHEEQLIEGAARIFRVSMQDDGRSLVKETP